MVVQNRKSSVLVTGGAGYIGNHAVLALRDAGFDVVVFDDLSTGFAESIPSDVPFIHASVHDEERLVQTIRDYNVSAVMHFAASLIVPESSEKPLAYWRNNVFGVSAMLGACVQTGVRNIVFSSTAAVYGIPEVMPIDEGMPCKPINPYGNSKYAAEQMISDVARTHGISSVTLRYFNVSGADPLGRAGQRSLRATHLIKVACEAVVGKRKKIEIFGTDYPTPDGTGVRDYIHVTDLANAHVAALRYLQKNNSVNLTMNCGYGRGHSVREVLSAVEKVSGKSLEIVESPRRVGDPPFLIAATQHINQVLDWNPLYDDLDFIIDTALKWEGSLAVP